MSNIKEWKAKLGDGGVSDGPLVRTGRETDGFEMLDDGKRPEVHVTEPFFKACNLQYPSIRFRPFSIIWIQLDFTINR